MLQSGRGFPPIVLAVTEPTIGPLPARSWPRRVFQLLGSTALWIGVMFGGAGRFDWLRGWIYVAAYVAMMATAAAAIHRANPGLFEARAHWRHRDTKPFDRVFLSIMLPLYFLQPGVAGMDAVRFGWRPLPMWTLYFGLILFAWATILISWAMAVNPYAESTVRIQTDRGHTVIASGPYRFVRHPMYVGAILMVFGTPLILGSLWALVISVAIAVLFTVRTALEDHTLRRELAGYEPYAARTRYRLLPGVW